MKKVLKKLFACITVCALAVSSSLAVSAAAIAPTTYIDDFTGYTDEALAAVTNGTDEFKPVLVNSDNKGWSSWSKGYRANSDGNCYVIVDARNATNAKGNTISGFESDGAKSLFIRSTDLSAVGVRPTDFSGASPKLGVPNYGDSITGYNYTGFKFRMTHTNSPDSYTGLRIFGKSENTYNAAYGYGFLFGLLGSSNTFTLDGNMFDGEKTENITDKSFKKEAYANCPIFAVINAGKWFVYSLASNIKVVADGGSTNAQYIDWDIEINGKTISWTATATYLDGSTKSWVSSYTNERVQESQVAKYRVPFLFNRISYDSTKYDSGMFVTNFSATYTKWNDISAKSSSDSVSLYVKPNQLGAAANKISYIYAAYDESGALLGAQIAESGDITTTTVEKKVFSKPTGGTIKTQKIYVWDGEVNACKPLLANPVAVK